MIKFPNADGTHRTMFQRGDTVRVQMVFMKQPVDFTGTVTDRNESIEPGKYYYKVTGHSGWIYEPSVSEVI